FGTSTPQLCDIAARKRRERTLLSAARHREVQAVLQSGACRLRCFGLPFYNVIAREASAARLGLLR
ncbi:MAG TPA: hypothetical protein VMS82_13395, partial [Pseudolabrys sp.]|nr:hypothetical protein [Pseudolabrys sp.]